MDKVKVLIEGYAKKTKKGWIASGTTCLIQSSQYNIIVDPGINRSKLLNTLKDTSLDIKDINKVFLTHYHPDHSLLASLFEYAVLYDGDICYENDTEIGYKEEVPGTDIKVVPTPGHANEHASLVVNTKDMGVVVIAADVFWWMDDEEQNCVYDILIKRKDPFAVDEVALLESRKKLLQIADVIIPGHGKKFKNLFKGG
jgi:glyoxylase-like metal-dependent hydrolase (beta-lactamase superfamily II)